MKDIKDLKIIKDVDMSKYTSYKTGGIAKILAYPQTIEALIKLMDYIKSNNIKYFVLGNGTNIIFTDAFYDGIIISLKKMNYISIYKDIIEVSSGYSLQKLVGDALNQSLSGLEFAAGIPGTIGGAIYMNAGAFGSSISNIIKSVAYLENGKVITKTKDDLGFDYRTSYFKTNKNMIILNAKIKLVHSSKEEIKSKMKEYIEKRRNTQPLEYPNAGSVFKNPENISAGALIDQKLCLKGEHIGDAYVSDKHANFIINKGTAKSKDIIELIEKIQKEALEKENITLLLEQEIIK